MSDAYDNVLACRSDLRKVVGRLFHYFNEYKGGIEGPGASDLVMAFRAAEHIVVKNRSEKLNEILDSAAGFRNKINGEVLKLFTASDDGTKVYFSGGWVAVDDFDNLFEPACKEQ